MCCVSCSCPQSSTFSSCCLGASVASLTSFSPPMHCGSVVVGKAFRKHTHAYNTQAHTELGTHHSFISEWYVVLTTPRNLNFLTPFCHFTLPSFSPFRFQFIHNQSRRQKLISILQKRNVCWYPFCWIQRLFVKAWIITCYSRLWFRTSFRSSTWMYPTGYIRYGCSMSS